jgi:hypothetical protein
LAPTDTDRYSVRTSGNGLFYVVELVAASEALAKLGTSPRFLRPGRPRPSAAGAVSLLGGCDPILLVHRPPTISLPHLGLGHVHSADPVGLADIQFWQTFKIMAPVYNVTARAKMYPIFPVTCPPLLQIYLGSFVAGGGRSYLRGFMTPIHQEVLASCALYKLPQLYVMPQDVVMAPGP